MSELQLNSGQPVYKGLPYLKAIGLDFNTVRRVSLVGGRVRVDSVIHNGTSDMPPLCGAQFELEIQIGCTPNDKGYKKGPGLEESSDQWCPCSIDLDPTYQEDTGFVIDTTREYPIIDDKDGEPIYGPLISYTLLTPTRALEDGPSPKCSAISPPSDTPEARLKLGGAALSEVEDAFTSLLTFADRLSLMVENILDNQHNETDDRIEAQWRSLLSNFTQAQFAHLDRFTLMERMIKEFKEAADTMLSLNSFSAFSASKGQDFNLEGVAARVNLGLPFTREIGKESLPSSTIDVSGKDIQQCVRNSQGGLGAHFHFIVGGGNRTYAPPEENESPDIALSAASAGKKSA
ncbi:hypothetical protein DUNSADRAFT_16014 [Dunaliella salina]|uniref:Encoded protein n=1 Tax=Dunaliella salina TaxID=3046 RepID=A0ABQ7H1A0_DUNSA|nr:hypothetical protein DUNSADRAFT_16014 [Dunaliella salina]|eukprot:KAF5840641.1 hypothetical protein DUNSADRAFT_16014 [Dunaliella salina]